MKSFFLFINLIRVVSMRINKKYYLRVCLIADCASASYKHINYFEVLKTHKLKLATPERRSMRTVGVSYLSRSLSTTTCSKIISLHTRSLDYNIYFCLSNFNG